MNMSHEITPEQITPRFIAALVKWQKKGRRTVDIKIPPLYFDEEGAACTVWCYDSDLMEGEFVTKITEIPTTKQLAESKRLAIEKERAELRQRLAEMEGEK
ncbi:MAG: hypothetical protein KJ804_12135 [Proteobacteria bacterium]|nr:hypothetical protein [Pseudomonadota bacterium]MBU1059052.1 hypothetical protein [Pseudomonadota bacterium]